MNEMDFYKFMMMMSGVNMNDEEAVRNYITRDIVKEGLPTAKQEALINSMMAHMGFGKDESEYTYNEIFKLKAMLEEANIPFQMGKGVSGGYHIQYLGKYNQGKVVCSVIETPTSYGIEDDLLEIQGLMTKEEIQREQDDVLGYLTAEDVFDRIYNDYNKQINEEDINEVINHFLKMFNNNGNTSDFSAILRLRDMLTEANIPHEFKKHQFGEGYHLEYQVNGRQVYSIIQTNFSYGAKEGKVEIMGNGIDALPFSVEEAFDIIKKYHDENEQS